MILSTNDDCIFERLRSPTKPFSARARQLFAHLSLNIDIPVATNITIIAPWDVSKRTEFINDLTRFKKQDTHPLVYKTEFKKILSAHRQYSRIYTDGSKDENRTGCAIFHSTATLNYRLPRNFSIFSAELYAIKKAIAFQNNTDQATKTLIVTDSLSSCLAIHSYNENKNYLVSSIKAHINALHPDSVIKFVWVPGHVGITGNEIVDRAAGEALELEETEIQNIQTPTSDLFTLLSQHIHNSWNDEWCLSLSNKLRDIKPTVMPWEEHNGIQRKYRVALTRLRIGHTHLTHSHLFSRESPPVCGVCDVEVTVKHILLDCRLYEINRQNVGLSNNLNEVLGNEANELEKLFKFLTETQLLNSL